MEIRIALRVARAEQRKNEKAKKRLKKKLARLHYMVEDQVYMTVRTCLVLELKADAKDFPKRAHAIWDCHGNKPWKCSNFKTVYEKCSKEPHAPVIKRMQHPQT